MGTIIEKLVYLNGTKQAIKQAINEDFEVIDDNTTFREYADEISSNNAKYKDLIPKETTNATNTLDISNSAGLDKALVTQYGNTYQEGEPTPDTPQEIVNISGKSTLKDVGENLFDKDNTNIINAYINNSVLKAAGESGGSFYIPCEPNTTYTVSKTELFGNDRFCVFDTYRIPTAGDTILSYVGKPTGGNSDTSLTITTNATATYLGIFAKAGETSPAKTFQEIADTIQVEKNPTATEYEAYKEQSFDLDLKSRNELNPFNILRLIGSGAKTVDNEGYITSIADSDSRAMADYNTSDYHVILPAGTYKLLIEIKEITTNVNNAIRMYDKIGNIILSINTPFMDVGSKLYEFVLTEKTDIGLTLKTYLSKVRFSILSSGSTYEPYYDINLCKIDTYKDRIYHLNGKWCLEKNIGKVVLNGSESWSYTAVAQGSLFREVSLLNNAIIDDTYAPYCNYYQGIPRATTRANNNIICNIGSNFHYLDIVDNRYTNADDFKAWLSTHNAILYYVLATPTTEEITESNYPTLYNQLNNIKLFEGVNHITMTNESGLDVEFDIEYYKDWKLD